MSSSDAPTGLTAVDGGVWGEGRRLLAWATVALVAAVIGRLTLMPDIQVVLISPLTGVAYLWLASSSVARRWWLDVPALSAVAALSVLVSAGTPGQMLFGALLAPVQPIVTIVLMRLWCPGLWGSGGSHRLSTLRDVGRFLLAAAAGATVAATLRADGLGLVPALPAIGIVMTWIRNYCWIVSLGIIGLQVGPSTTRATVRHGLTGIMDRARHTPVGVCLEAGAVLVITISTFVLLVELPVKFALTLITVWVALRFSPLIATLHGLTCGLVGLLLALNGVGIFAVSGGDLVSAAVAQAFACVMVITGATVGLSVQARKGAVGRAEAAETAAQERSALLDTVISELREGIVVLRADGSEVIRNAAGGALLGAHDLINYDQALPGPSYGLFVDGRRLRTEELPHARALAGLSLAIQDYVVRSPEEPAGLVLEVGATHLAAAHPHEPGLAVVHFQDVTTERRERDNLAAFAGVVAHDLSNPLSVVSGWTEALIDEFAEGPVGSNDGAAMATRIKDAAGHMQGFIEDLLGYTVARDRPLRREVLDLTDLTESVARMRRESTSRPRITIQTGLEVYGDLAMIRQLMDNLIGNATKYVAPGVRSHVDINAVDRGDHVCVIVCDNGIGVPPEKRHQIFENFQRAHAGDYQGTGLGLAICQRIVQRHGGVIEVEDNPLGTGSLFSFTLPTAPAASQAVFEPVNDARDPQPLST